MRSQPPPTRSVWWAHPGYLGAYCLDVVLTFSLGLTALLGDDDRFTAPAYHQLRETGVAAWGVLLVAGGVALVIGAFRTTQWMTIVLSAWSTVYLLLAIWFGMSAASDIKAAWWGTIIFGVLAGWHLTQANEYRRAQG